MDKEWNEINYICEKAIKIVDELILKQKLKQSFLNGRSYQMDILEGWLI